MNKSQIYQSLQDILPTFSGKFPLALISYIDSIYLLSLQKLPVLPNKADVARYHICAYLAAEKYQKKFSLPAPLLKRVPVQPQFIDRLLDDIEEKVMGSMSSPTTTPKKLTFSENLPMKRPHTPNIGSPLKKLQKLLDVPDDNNAFAMKSPFNPDGKVSHDLRNQDSPFNVTPKALESSPSRNLFKTPRSSPLKNASASSPRYMRHLTIPEFISFANNFYIPASVTPLVLETFMVEKYKFVKKNEWLLACGLIHAAYVRINDKLLKSTIGKKAEFQDQLFQYQKGGLMKSNMVEWINRIEESIKGQPWALDLELKYVHNDWTVEDTTREKEIQAKLGRGWDLIQGFGSMINPSVMFSKPSQVEYYNVWTRRVREKVKAVEALKEPAKA